MDNQKLVFSVLQRVVRGEDEPMVALIEDLHWLDPTSEMFLAQWVDAVPQSYTSPIFCWELE